MATLTEIRKTRLEKLKRIRDARIEPYPQTTKRTHQIIEILNNFAKFKKEAKEVIVAGRIKGLRGHGGAVFFDVADGTGKIQALFRKDTIGATGFKIFQDFFDIGDFIEVRGLLVETKTKEKTLQALDFKMLAKSLLPLPEKWHGLQDIEERYRKRYLDLLFNEEVKNKFLVRSKIIQGIRGFMGRTGFLEVETPTLQPIYGGARAKPFKTHLNALDMDLYLRIAPELYLKRLIVGGFEKVYELGKCFRNEGMDKSHNPEYTHFEFYWAYADYKELMKLIEKMFAYLLKDIFGKTEIEYEGKKIDFKTPWQRIEFSDLLQRFTKINLDEINKETLYKKAGELGVKVEKEAPKAEIADEIYKKYCREKIFQPTFVINHPYGLQPLAKALEKSPDKLASFQLLAAGLELTNAFSELNDPQEQEKRFKEQETLHKQGLEEAQRMDEDFIEALEYGMPPCAGFGMGIDRLAALLTNSHALREVILFPTMKPKEE